MPSFDQLRAIDFRPDGSAAVMDFTRHDKTTLSCVRLHSEQQPGRFAFTRNYRPVFVGTATRDEFWLLLYRHGWQPRCLPIPPQYRKDFKQKL